MGLDLAAPRGVADALPFEAGVGAGVSVDATILGSASGLGRWRDICPRATLRSIVASVGLGDGACDIGSCLYVEEVVH